MAEPLLKATNVVEMFGGLKAVSDFNMHIDQGELIGLIGPNGAGKTTAFNLFTGVYQPTSGHIEFEGDSLVGLKPYQITQRGIARTFQNIRLFSSMTVFENVLTAHHLRRTSNLFTAALRINAAEERRMREDTDALLRQVDLYDLRDEMATSLPYGKQRLLEIVRALATKPKLLLLDEPAAGMNPQETDELGEFIRRIRSEFDLSIFIIEHHMNLVMKISDRIYVIEFGKQIAEGVPEEIQNNEAVIQAYLGGGDEL
ncbi:MAG: ABC transporter ATP-binding protein [Schwartzia sp.]|nr:ABC transporter ATP-binding protein [Schwartzia sp. (in: firmicutes)]